MAMRYLSRMSGAADGFALDEDFAAVRLYPAR